MRPLAITTTLLAGLFVVSGCATTHRSSQPVSVESRPTPPQPPPPPPDSASTQPAPEPVAEPPPMPPSPVQSSALLARAVADTAEARAALTRCAGHKLLPDQEGIYDATLKLLDAARAAFIRGDALGAASEARRARQTAAALDCR